MTTLDHWLNADSTPDAVAALAVLLPVLIVALALALGLSALEVLL